jgi:hypothetical protein
MSFRIVEEERQAAQLSSPSSRQSVTWWIFIFVLVLQGVLEKLSLSSLEGSNLVPKR